MDTYINLVVVSVGSASDGDKVAPQGRSKVVAGARRDVSQNLGVKSWSWWVPHLHKTSLLWKGNIVLRRKWLQKLPKSRPLLRISPRSWETAKFCEQVASRRRPCSGGRQLRARPTQVGAGASPNSSTMQSAAAGLSEPSREADGPGGRPTRPHAKLSARSPA